MSGDFMGPSQEEMGIKNEEGNKEKYIINFDEFEKIKEISKEKFAKDYGGNGELISMANIKDFAPGGLNDITEIPIFDKTIMKHMEEASRILSSKNKAKEIVVVEGQTYAIDNKLIKPNEERFKSVRDIIMHDRGIINLGDYMAELKNELKYENKDKVDSIEFLGGGNTNIVELQELMKDEEFLDKFKKFSDMIFGLSVNQKKENKNAKNIQEEEGGGK